MSARIWRYLSSALLLSFCATASFAQNTDAKVPPVIDVHVHAMDGNFPGLAPMCPNTSKFTASDPKEKEAPFGWGTWARGQESFRPWRGRGHR